MAEEQTLYQDHPAMFRNHPFGFVLSIVLCAVGVGLIILLIWWLRCKATTLTVTDERTSLRRGLLSKSINEVWHQDIRNVQIYQTFLQRIFGVGDIGISSAGQAGVELAVKGLPSPDEVKSLIDKYRREAT